MKTYILRSPDGDGGSAADALQTPAKPAPNPTPAAPPEKPAATPPPAKEAAKPEAEIHSDDPFEPPKKPAAAAPAKPAEKPVAKPDFDPAKAAPKELRTAYETAKANEKSLSEKVKEYERKIAEKEAAGKDTTALTERLATIEKERDAALADLRAARQEASPEFKEKYDKPFNMAAERAKRQVTELTITNEAGESRPATWNDFVSIYSLPTGKAIEQAEALFGKSANFVLNLREKLMDLDTARATALEEEKAQFKERTAKEIAQQAQKREHVGKLWGETNKRLAESVPDYKDDPEDAEAIEVRKHALSVFDSKIEGADEQDFINKKISKDAHIRQKVGALAVTKLKLSRALSENETLKKQIEELKGAEPGKTKRPSGQVAESGEDDWAEGLVKAVAGAA